MRRIDQDVESLEKDKFVYRAIDKNNHKLYELCFIEDILYFASFNGEPEKSFIEGWTEVK